MAGAAGPRDGDVELLMELSRSMVAVAVRSLDAVDGQVTLPQFRALTVLLRGGPSTVGRVAELVGLHVSSVTRLCDRLVAAGLITRQPRPENRREVELGLTERGADLVHRAWDARSQRLEEALSALSGPEHEALRTALPSLIERLHEQQGASLSVTGW